MDPKEICRCKSYTVNRIRIRTDYFMPCIRGRRSDDDGDDANQVEFPIKKISSVVEPILHEIKKKKVDNNDDNSAISSLNYLVRG